MCPQLRNLIAINTRSGILAPLTEDVNVQQLAHSAYTKNPRLA